MNLEYDTLYESTKYFATLDNLKEKLENYGIAIIPNILNDNECQQMASEMWDYLEHITQNWETPINRNDENTWKQINELNMGTLLFQFWSIGHSQMAWNVRQNPKIVNVFAKFWNVQPEDLISSFDGCSFELLPNERKIDPWWHVDHSYINSEFRNIQSWVTAFDVEPGDATLTILESSHKNHKDFAETFEVTSERDFSLLYNEHLQYYLDRFPIKRICCPKGSLVLWDSRLVHYGLESKNKKNIRCISYLCYLPRSQANESILKLKRHALEHLKTTNHDPVKVTFKPQTPNMYDMSDIVKIADLVSIEPPILSELGYKLAGY